ncbi:GrpB family protein [Metabacillus herbersteinensis]|uniref:GrpB family protein n=1 Tax=Metabacillus herbersteinensis TaxID=283816 RepID=A0ABV6GAQ0_9BACI
MEILLTAHNPDWKIQFQQEKLSLLDALKNLSPEIEHVGSTSVENLAAKPIIDIMIGVHTEHELESVVELLKPQPYVYKEIYNEELPFRRFFVGLKEEYIHQFPKEMTKLNNVEIPHEYRTSHLHVVPIQSQWWEDHLLFRDHLRENPEDRLEYEKVKKQLSTETWENGNEYAEAKTGCIQTILKKAKENKRTHT